MALEDLVVKLHSLVYLVLYPTAPITYWGIIAKVPLPERLAVHVSMSVCV